MKSVGEVMAIGRTFQESFQKALRGLEIGKYGLCNHIDLDAEGASETIYNELGHPGAERIWYLADAMRSGMTMGEVHEITKIDPWFLIQIEDIIKQEELLKAEGGES